jgi:hypothetical protein
VCQEKYANPTGVKVL